MTYFFSQFRIRTIACSFVRMIYLYYSLDKVILIIIVISLTIVIYYCLRKINKYFFNYIILHCLNFHNNFSYECLFIKTTKNSLRKYRFPNKYTYQNCKINKFSFFKLSFQEVFLPLYILGILIVVKLLIPNPNYPAIVTQRQEGDLFEFFNGYKNNTIAVVPNSTETLVSGTMYYMYNICMRKLQLILE